MHVALHFTTLYLDSRAGIHTKTVMKSTIDKGSGPSNSHLPQPKSSIEIPFFKYFIFNECSKIRAGLDNESTAAD